jgi:hypothetical protein
MTTLYKKLNLPAVPENLIPDFDQLLSNQVAPIWSNQPRIATKDGQIVEHSRYDRYDISAELKSWVDNNITADYKNIGISCMWDASVNLPHTDHTRDATMIYLFHTGGDTVETKFWRRQGYPIHHENKDLTYQYNSSQPTTYDDLDLLDSIIVPANQWYILDACCIHSVEGMTDSRISLQLGFLRQSRWAQQIFGELTEITDTIQIADRTTI